MLRIADDLNSCRPEVHAALAAGDAAWVDSALRRILARRPDGLDLHVDTLGDAAPSVLEWLAQRVEARSDLPIFLDSARPERLVPVARVRRRPAVLNSLAADLEWPPEVEELLRSTDVGVVLQLRGERELPRDLPDRRALAERGLHRLSRLGVRWNRVFVDPVLLPWGTDLEAGRAMTEFVRGLPLLHPATRSLVGLGNAGHGQADPSLAERTWCACLREAGLGAALMRSDGPAWAMGAARG